MAKITLGKEGYVENGVMFIFSISKDTQKELESKGFIKDDSRKNIRIKDEVLVKALYVRWMILAKYGVLIEYALLWEMLKDERYINLWEKEDLESISDSYPREYLLELYEDIKTKKILTNMQKALKGKRIVSKYIVEIQLTKREYIEVEAFSEEEAKEKAFKQFYSTIEEIDEDVRCLSIDSEDED